MIQAIRASQFFTLGYTNFGQRGYNARSKRFTPGALDVDLRGRHYIITGASSGLGRATAEALAARGGSVHLVCRGLDKGREVLHAITASGGDATLHQCDISSLSDVKRFVDDWKNTGYPISALINNAGCMVHDRKESNEGIESNFATNTLGTFALTELLRPSLEESGDARVVTVSSAGMLTADLEIKDLEGSDLTKQGTIDGTVQYARNKRQQVALTEYWAKEYGSKGIFWASMHPGWASTPGVEKSMPAFHKMMKNQMRNVEQGADTIVWLSIADEAVKYSSGEFFFDRAVAPKHLWMAGTDYKQQRVGELAKKLREMIEQKGFELPKAEN